MKENVILMFVDDLGYGDVSMLNENSKISTPNIDALGERGVCLTDCHATSALCTPSRYGLLTGRYNWRSRLKCSVLPGGADPLIESGRKTLADMFREKGYFTAAVGKWHLGLGWERKAFSSEECGTEGEKSDDPFRFDGLDIDFTKPIKVSPNDYGFDYFFGTAASLDQPPYVYIENKKLLGIPDHITGVFPLDRKGATQQQMWQRGPAVKDHDFKKVIPDMQEKVLELIEENYEKPFFIYYPTHAVHGPLLPPEEFEGVSGLNCYADMVLYVDHMVGEIVAKLKEKGIWENTIFIFASDNGCSGVADYSLLTQKGHNPSYIFRGKKADIWEGGHRVPAIISRPSVYNERTDIDNMVCLSDIYATFAQLLGVELAPDMGEDSFSILPLLEGGEENVRQYIVHSSGDGSFGIRSKQWKLELCRHGGAGWAKDDVEPTTSEEVPYQLYDMIKDVGEKRNVAAENPEVCLQMTMDLLKIIENGRSTEGEVQENAGMEHWEQLTHVKNLIPVQLKNAQ